MPDTMLTTIDNPYDPFEQFDLWYEYDTRLGYNTSALLGRITTVSSELSEADQEVAHEAAIDEIIDNDVLGVYKIVIQRGSE